METMKKSVAQRLVEIVPVLLQIENTESRATRAELMQVIFEFAKVAEEELQ